MAEKRILPFYMTYPTSLTKTDDNRMIKDLEYFQQLYPSGAKLLQREIRRVIDIMDYEGSLIYDEYPDRFAMQKLTKDILEKIRLQLGDGVENSEELEMVLRYDNIEDYMYVLVLQEVWRRRNGQKRGYFLF